MVHATPRAYHHIVREGDQEIFQMDGGLKVLSVEQEVAGDIRPCEGKPGLGSKRCKDGDLREPRGARG
jgi:hypothetical protein